jgi:hypothetical protein
MANYCSNTLKVKGDVTELKHFLKRVKDENDKFTLYSLLPIPEEIKILENQDNWKHENWGTSYVCEDMFSSINETEVKINFESALAPPLLWIKYVAKFYDGLTFHLNYDEPGIGFKGSLNIKGENMIETINIYSETPRGRYISEFEKC